jgi:DNA repair exonuclease SbcCD ATPase subunit
MRKNNMSSINCEDLFYNLNEDNLSYNVHLKVNLNSKLENFDFSKYKNISKYSNIDKASKKFSIMIEKGKSYESLGKIYTLIKLLSEWNEDYTQSYVSNFMKNPVNSYFIQNKIHSMEIEKKINSSLEQLIQDNTSEIKKLSETLESQNESLKKLGEKYELIKDLPTSLNDHKEATKNEFIKIQKDINSALEKLNDYEELYQNTVALLGNQDLIKQIKEINETYTKLPDINTFSEEFNKVSPKIEILKDVIKPFEIHTLWKQKIDKQIGIIENQIGEFGNFIEKLENLANSQQQSN